MVKKLSGGGLTNTLLHSLRIRCIVAWAELNVEHGREGSTPLSGKKQEQEI